MPTLNFCVERDDEIVNFRPKNYYVLELEVVSPCNNRMNLSWSREREYDQHLAHASLVHVKLYSSAKVIECKTEMKSKRPPAALNTVEMLKFASSRLRIDPQKAMRIAEALYLKGWISFPKTETSVYPSSFDFTSLLEAQACSQEWGQHARTVLDVGINFSNHGRDSLDPPPIIPTGYENSNQMDSLSWQLYSFICRHFIASLSQEMTYEQTFAKLQIGEQFFTWTANRVLGHGFTQVFGTEMRSDYMLKRPLQLNHLCAVSSVKIACRKIRPPLHLSESELIGLMETNGIGTDSFIPQYITQICESNYVTVTEDRLLLPTALGRALIHGFKKIDPSLVIPDTRSQMERNLKNIVMGKQKYQDVLFDSICLYNEKFFGFLKKIDRLDGCFALEMNEIVKQFNQPSGETQKEESPKIFKSLNGSPKRGMSSGRGQSTSGNRRTMPGRGRGNFSGSRRGFGRGRGRGSSSAVESNGRSI